MSDNLVPEFAQLSVRSDKVGEEESPASFTRTNGEEEKGKNNPWKLIPSAENNALEADAWPAPSAPTEQRRPAGARQSEEKPKKKIKWQNYEVSNATFAIRGRGSYTGPSFSAPHYTFRRGGPGYRGRGTDSIRPRGANGLYSRNPFRVPVVRNSVEPREEKFPVSVAVTVNTHVASQLDSTRHKVSPIDDNPETQSKTVAGVETSVSGSVASTSSGALPTYEADSTEPVRSALSQSSQIKRSYRDRLSGPQGVSAQTSATGMYEAGPVGRARRCYMRQHQTAYVSEPESTAQHSLVSTAIQPLVQYQPVAPFTYYISGTPAVGATLWGTNLQLSASTGSHHSVHTNVAPISVTNPTLIPVPNPQTIVPSVAGVDGVHPALGDVGLTSSPILPQTLPRVFGDLPSFKGLNVSEVQVEVVDVDKVIAFVNERDWQNVVFPPSLKEHPAVAASIRAAASETEPVESNEGSTHRSEATPQPSTEATQEDTPNEKPVGKPDDVIIVDGRFFFVPRNANRTKFLKFISKFDYIRHHVEYYFSQSNLHRDAHLASILSANQDICPINELLQFNRLRFVSTTKSELLDAVASSPSVTVVYSPNGSPMGIARVVVSTPSMLPTSLNDTTYPANSTEPSSTSSNAIHVSDSTQGSGSSLMMNSSIRHTISNGDATPYFRPVHLNSTASTMSYVSTQTTTNSTVPVPSLIATPNHISAQYLQSPAFVLNSVPRVDLNNTSGTVAYPGFTASQLQQCYTQSDTGASLPQAASMPFPNQQNLYPHPQALATAAGNQPTLLSHPNQPNLQSPDGGAAFMTAIYRIAAPGHPSPSVGAFIPSVGNTSALAAPNNPHVFVQLLPTAHPSAGYLGPNASNPSSIFNRPVGSLNPGIWIPVATPGGIAVPNIATAPPFPHYVTVSHGPPNLTVPNAVGASFNSTSTLPAVPTALIDALYTGQTDQNSSNLAPSQLTRHSMPSGNHAHATAVSSTANSLQVVTTSINSSSAHPGSNVNRVSANHHALSFAPDPMTLSVSSTGSNQPTPKKITVNSLP